jgi:hypothetical protein
MLDLGVRARQRIDHGSLPDVRRRLTPPGPNALDGERSPGRLIVWIWDRRHGNEANGPGNGAGKPVAES